MDQTQLATIQERSYFLSPATDVAIAVLRYKAMAGFIREVLHHGTDYGKVPGTDKDTLLKPGAEKLSSFFGLSPRFILRDSVEDWTGKDHDSEPFFYYRYACDLLRGDQLMGEGEGSCNSWEKKHRYRYAERLCPNCHKATIIKGKAEFGGGWVCFTKKGGCNAKFGDNDPAIVGQVLGTVKNPDPADLPNTLQKMAQKRALVAAVLIATNASEYFTQDAEDFAPTGDVIDAQMPPEPATHLDVIDKVEGQPIIGIVPDGEKVEYTGSLAKIGKNKYPVLWCQQLMANLKNLGGNAFEIDGILQKLALPQETTPAKVVEAVENYLAAKSDSRDSDLAGQPHDKGE